MSAQSWAQVKSIVGRALHVSHAQRLKWPDSLQTAHNEHIGQARRPLSAEETDTYLYKPELLQAEMERGPDAAKAPRRLAFQPGQTIAGRFEIKRFLGAGGMGEVYAAFDFESSELIALKTLLKEYARQELFVARLRRELQLARKLAHPNLCRVHDIHRVPLEGNGETSALSMEFLDGLPLSSHVKQGLWTLPEVLDVLRQIVAGLQAAHDANILHRDLKSGNVLIVDQARGTRRAVITDFGLAHQIVGPDETHSLLGTKAMVGTTAYMAPEQLRGEGVSKLSNVYSLGVIAFELVTGRLPFEGETALAIALRRLKQEAPAPQQFAPLLPSRWDLVIRACLSADPRHRPPSAAHFLRLLEGEESALRYRVRRHTRRAALSTLALSGAAAGYFAWSSSRPKVHPADAVRNFKQGQFLVQRRDQPGVLDAISEFRRAVTIDPGYAEAWASLANAYCAAAHYVFMPPAEARGKAEDAAKKALALDDHLAEAQTALAYTESLDLKRWRAAEPAFQKAIQLGPREPLPHTWYAAFLGRAARFEEAIKQAQIGFDLDPTDYSISDQRAFEYFRGRRYADYYQRSRELVRMHPGEPGAHLRLARACEWLGKFAEAEQECGKALEFEQSMSALSFLGTIEASRGNSVKAEQISTQVLAYWGQKPIEVNVVVCLLAKLGQFDRIMDLLDQAYAKGDGTILACPTNQYLDAMRPLPRYQAFLRELGFDPAKLA